MKYLLPIVTCAALVYCESPALSAKALEECRTKAAMDESITSMDVNSQKGGHVAKHIVGQNTEVGETIWDAADAKTSWEHFTAAFQAWKGLATKGKPKTCGTSGSATDCVSVTELGITPAATVCTQLNTKKSPGPCKTFNTVTAKAVAFTYSNDKETKGKWIIKTSFPSAREDCKKGARRR